MERSTLDNKSKFNNLEVFIFLSSLESLLLKLRDGYALQVTKIDLELYMFDYKALRWRLKNERDATFEPFLTSLNFVVSLKCLHVVFRKVLILLTICLLSQYFRLLSNAVVDDVNTFGFVCCSFLVRCKYDGNFINLKLLLETFTSINFISPRVESRIEMINLCVALAVFVVFVAFVVFLVALLLLLWCVVYK